MSSKKCHWKKNYSGSKINKLYVQSTLPTLLYQKFTLNTKEYFHDSFLSLRFVFFQQFVSMYSFANLHFIQRKKEKKNNLGHL